MNGLSAHPGQASEHAAPGSSPVPSELQEFMEQSLLEAKRLMQGKQGLYREPRIHTPFDYILSVTQPGTTTDRAQIREVLHGLLTDTRLAVCTTFGPTLARILEQSGYHDLATMAKAQVQQAIDEKL